VLITGESGVGKSLIAKRLHLISRRKNNLFLDYNVAAIPKEMISSELFGHVKGSFTGASNDRTGKFELADGGTIFLDEIGEMDLESQTYLLHVLENRSIQKLGSNKNIEIDVRIITGTNRNLLEAISQGKFREDLYYRINELPLAIQPLRERKEDIIPIAEYFLMVESEKLGKPFKFSNRVKKMLEEYSWPGNVRVLRSKVNLAVLLANHQEILEIKTEHFSLKTEARNGLAIELHEENTLNEYHESILRQLLQRHKNKRRIAQILDVTEATVHNWCKKFGI
jgi:transcriptional regulator with PAS, ATPase and Fis domain